MVATLLVGAGAGGQVRVSDLVQGAVEGAGVVAAVVDGVPSVQPGRAGVVGHFAGGDQVATAEFRRVEAQVSGHQVQQTLADEGALEEAGSAVGARTHLVGHHTVDRGMEVGDPVRPGHHHGGEGGDDAAVGADIGSHVAVDRGAQPQQRAVVAGRDLDLAEHFAGVVGRGQVLHPVLHPLHRASQPEGCEGDEEVLGVEFAAHAEAASHVRLDEVDAFLFDLQVAGKDCPVGVGYLGGTPDTHVSVGGVVAGNEATGLHRVGRVAVGAEFFPPRVLGLAEGRLDVADIYLGGTGEIAAVGRVHDHRIRQRFGDIRYRRHWLIVDLDEVNGVLGQVAALGDHDRDRLAGVAHGVGGQGRLQVVVQSRQREHPHGDGLGKVGHVGVGEHGFDAIEGQGRRCVDAQHPGVGVGTAQDGGVQHPRQTDVVQVLPLPGDETDILPAPQWSTDVRGDGWCAAHWVTLPRWAAPDRRCWRGAELARDG